jgi:cytochrome c oxidase subunit 2
MKKKLMMLILSVGVLITATLPHTDARAQDAPQRIEITAKRFEYSTKEITVKKGQPVVLVLKSLDVPHGLRFSDLNVEVKVSAGGTAEVQFTPQTTGDFVGQCFVFCGKGHGMMALTMHVVD